MKTKIVKTRNEAANNYAMMSQFKSDYPHCSRSGKDGFIEGVIWAETFIPVDECLPPVDESHPKYSVDCLVKDNTGRMYYACYNFMLSEWASNETQYELFNITHFRPIEHK